MAAKQQQLSRHDSHTQDDAYKMTSYTLQLFLQLIPQLLCMRCLQELGKVKAPAAAAAVAEPPVSAATSAAAETAAAAVAVADPAVASTAPGAEPEVAESSAAPQDVPEAKSDEYTEEMQARMGTTLTYRHEDGINYNYVLPDLIVGSCLQGPEDVDRLQAAGVTTVFSLQVPRGAIAEPAAGLQPTAFGQGRKRSAYLAPLSYLLP